jgi:hypothetical protein
LTLAGFALAAHRLENARLDLAEGESGAAAFELWRLTATLRLPS